MDIVNIDTATLKDGVITYQGGQPVGDDPEDKEPVRGDSFQCLGVTSFPAAATEAGSAEVCTVAGVGGMSEIAIGGRDTRSAPKLGGLKPGDTVLHSTDPETDSQFRAMGKDRKVVMFARESDGTMATLMIDAKSKKLQFVGFGGAMEFSKDGGWSFQDSTGAGFNINGGNCTWNVTNHFLRPGAALPVRVGPAAVGGAPAPGVWAIVSRMWAWLRWWAWTRIPEFERC
jgi:hypothetical protein